MDSVKKLLIAYNATEHDKKLQPKKEKKTVNVFYYTDSDSESELNKNKNDIYNKK